MQITNVTLGKRTYPIYVGRDLLHSSELIRKHATNGKLMLVADEIVAPLHATRISSVLTADGFDVCMHTFTSGEESKTVATWQALIDAMLINDLGRDAVLIAVGGGVVGDLTGFAAACYMRGIQFIQIPTTLLSQLDSSVGGKTAVNHPGGKNLIGAFHQPTAVIIDTDTLNTLDERNYRSGFAEAVKLALATDSELFATLEAGIDRFLAREPEFLATIIGRCCELKASIVAEDEHETGRRTLLNLGHTFGHALEKMGDYKKWLHGEAVSLGIAIAMKLSHEVNDLENSAVNRSISLLKQADLPVELPGDFNYGALVNAMRGDKKSQAGKIRLVLLAALGEAQLGNPMEFEDLLLLLNKLGIN